MNQYFSVLFVKDFSCCSSIGLYLALQDCKPLCVLCANFVEFPSHRLNSGLEFLQGAILPRNLSQLKTLFSFLFNTRYLTPDT